MQFIGYGFCLGKDKPISKKILKDASSWAEKYDRLKGHPAWDEAGIRLENGREEGPGDDLPDLYLFIEESVGWVKKLSPKRKYKISWNAKLEDFCKTMNLRSKIPQWVILGEV